MESGVSAADETTGVYRKRARRLSLWPALIVVALLALGYFTYERLQPPPAMVPPQGPVPVSTVTLQAAPVEVWNSFSARTRAVNEADIRPEVSGRITEIRFNDGQNVKAGDVLLVIDPRPYEAALKRAKAALTTAQANATFAKTELGRAAGMIKTGAIAQRLYDQRADESHVNTAALQSAQADVETAQLNVEHAFVRAPIAGRTGRTELTVGNLVEAGPNAPLLTSIVSTDGIYADFEVNEQTYMQAVHNDATGLSQEQKIPVELITGDEGGRVYKGTIYSFDNHIDSATGTIRARAKFANEDGSLVPGMFVSVRLAGVQPVKALLVPEQAIQTDQDKKFVYTVVGGKATYQAVTLGASIGDKHVVLTGLHDGDQVIVDGVQHVQPGTPVTVKDAASTITAPTSSAVQTAK
jgi:multidrug efflux system membrane fusion protein